MRLLPYSLQRRFLLGLLAIVLVIGTFFTLLLRHHIKELLVSEAHAKADLMVAHVESIQNYVRNVLRPITSSLVEQDKFIIETMSSSYVSRRILGGLDLDGSNFIYRRVSKNARNPAYEINAQEELFFKGFLEAPEARRKEEIVTRNGKEQLVIARPVYFTENCMRCHGNPADAPAGLVEMYGADRGFHRSTGELAGLDIISVDMGGAAGTVTSFATTFAAFFFLGMLLLLLSVQGFFNRLVVHNLQRVGEILQHNLRQEEDQKILAPLHDETEIERMIKSIAAVASYLGDARRQLGDYARNLESMVKDRTAALETILKARSADVRIFMRLLGDLNSNKDKRTLLRTSLSLIARHFGAARAVYICGLAGTDYMEWPGEGAPLNPEERENLFKRLREGKAFMADKIWYIPVQTTGQARGILGLYWDEEPQPEDTPRTASSGNFPFALSLGNQLGIALDNMDALDALLRQNTLLESVVGGVSDPLILLEQDMTPILTNSPAQRLAEELAERMPETAGKRDAAATRELLFLLELMGLHPAFRYKGVPLLYETVLHSGRSFMVNVRPLSMDNRGKMRMVAHLRETTEEKRILEHMRQTEKLAAVGQLAAGLAHEINNPLGVIRCYAELLHASTDDEQSLADLATILRHVEQAQTVLSNMLNFSRQHKPSPAYCSIAELLRHLVETYSPQAAASHVELRLDAPPDLPDIYMDRHMLEQVLVNLILNALDAMKKAWPEGGGLLTLMARNVSNGIVISVADNGPGVREDILPKVFEPFFTTKDPGKGTGLGLSIAFGIVNDLGGRLEVESPYGENGGGGAAFHVTIPTGSDG